MAMMTRLKYLRLLAGLRVMDISMKTYMHPTVINQLESGRLTSRPTLAKLAVLFGETAERLMEEVEATPTCAGVPPPPDLHERIRAARETEARDKAAAIAEAGKPKQDRRF